MEKTFGEEEDINLTNLIFKQVGFKKVLEHSLEDGKKLMKQLLDHEKLIRNNIKKLNSNKGNNEEMIKELEKALSETKKIQETAKEKIKKAEENYERKEKELAKKKQEEMNLKMEKYLITNKFRELEDKKQKTTLQQAKYKMDQQVAEKKKADTEKSLKSDEMTREEIIKRLQDIDSLISQVKESIRQLQSELLKFKNLKTRLELEIQQNERKDLEFQKKMAALTMRIQFEKNQIKNAQLEIAKAEALKQNLGHHIQVLQNQINQLYNQVAQIRDYTYTTTSGCLFWKKTHYHHVSRQGERDAVYRHIQCITSQQNSLTQQIMRHDALIDDRNQRIFSWEDDINHKEIEISQLSFDIHDNNKQKQSLISNRKGAMDDIQTTETNLIAERGKLDVLNNQKIITTSSKVDKEKSIEEVKSALIQVKEHQKKIELELESNQQIQKQLESEKTKVTDDLSTKEVELNVLNEETQKIHQEKMEYVSDRDQQEILLCKQEIEKQTFQNQNHFDEGMIEENRHLREIFLKKIEHCEDQQLEIEEMLENLDKEQNLIEEDTVLITKNYE